jgi:hypothetical protein
VYVCGRQDKGKLRVRNLAKTALRAFISSANKQIERMEMSRQVEESLEESLQVPEGKRAEIPHVA